MHIYKDLLDAKQSGRKKFAVLIDPDKLSLAQLDQTIELAVSSSVDYFFIGGSLLVRDTIADVIALLKERCSIPLILFPGNALQVNDAADGILLLSLLSGRNPELLIGQHVIAAPLLKKSKLEILSTGYILIDGGVPTSVSYMSNTNPIPADKTDIAVCTAMAGEMLGTKLIYLEAGSGAKHAVPLEMIKSCRANIDIPLIVGGGIKNAKDALERCEAGADMIVIGNAIEKDPQLIKKMASAIHGCHPPIEKTTTL